MNFFCGARVLLQCEERLVRGLVLIAIRTGVRGIAWKVAVVCSRVTSYFIVSEVWGEKRP